jgi:protein-tyrosine kinase
MTAKSYRDTLLRNWRLALACIVIAALAGAGGSFLTKTYYRASTVVTLNIPANVGAAYNADKFVQSSIQLATGSLVLNVVAQNVPGVTEAQLASEVSASQIAGSNSMTIVVLDPVSGDRAAAIANADADATATHFKQQQDQDFANAQLPLQTNLANTERMIVTTQQSLLALPNTPDNAAQRTLLQTQLDALTQQYTSYNAALALVQQNDATTTVVIHTVKPATTGSAQHPQMLQIIGASLLIGFAAALGLIALLDFLNQRVTGETAGDILGWPVLATITDRTKKEEYETLRKNLTFLDIAAPIHSIAVTSAGPDADSSDVSARLALFLQEGGARTLLVDANMQAPSQQSRFGLPGGEGFTDAVLDSRRAPTSELGRFLYVSRTIPAPSLRIMPAGTPPPNPSVLLKSPTLIQLFRALANVGAETIVFDTPSIARVPETAAFASCMNGTIVVVDPSKTNRYTLQKVRATLDDAQVHVLGCVVIAKELAHA